MGNDPSPPPHGSIAFTEIRPEMKCVEVTSQVQDASSDFSSPLLLCHSHVKELLLLFSSWIKQWADLKLGRVVLDH